MKNTDVTDVTDTYREKVIFSDNNTLLLKILQKLNHAKENKYHQAQGLYFLVRILGTFLIDIHMHLTLSQLVIYDIFN